MFSSLTLKPFEEIEHNTSLTLSAALIVLLVSLVSGVGNGLFNSFRDKTFLSGFLGSLISVILGWLIWSAVTWFVGTRLFKGQADLGEMLRVIGFAYLPYAFIHHPMCGWGDWHTLDAGCRFYRHPPGSGPG